MAEYDMLLEPLRDASAWTRADMESDRSWVYELSAEEISEIESALQQVQEKGLEHAEICEADFPLPHIGPLVTKLRDQIEDGRGIAVLKGMPIQGKTVEQQQLLYAGVAAHIGQSIIQDPQGTLIDLVTDRGLSYDDIAVRGYTTNAELTPHCDSGDIVSLLCIRQAREGGINTLASSMAIYNEILAKHREYLEPLYTGFHYNLRGSGPPGKYVDITAHRVPVYSYHQGKLSCRFNQKAMLTAEQLPGVPPLSQLEKDAINKVAELSVCEEFGTDVMLESGDLLLLSNHTVFHTRAAFTDWEDPEKKRLLMRKWINIPNARALTWEFGDHYNTGIRQGPWVEGEPGQVVEVA